MALAGWLLCALGSAPASLGDSASGGDATSRGTWSASGSIGLELRVFPEDPAQQDQLDGDQLSGLFEPELRWRSTDRRHQVDLALFGRLDGGDDERSHLDLREGSYRYVGDSFELLAGVSRVFWGVTESRHLVDVINQTDSLEDIDEEDKLGQPMVRLAFDRGWGRLEVYSLLGFRERTFPGREGRLRPPLPIARRVLPDSGGEIDLALRWSQAFGDWDLAAHVFHGTGREPRFVLADDVRSLIPVYERTNQAGVEVQHTRGAWLFKLEALAREGQGETFGAAVAGFEHTFYQIAGSVADLGLLLEISWDGRDTTAPPTIYDEDTFLGARLALNDIQDTQVLMGAVVDHDDHSLAGFVEASRRFGRRTTLELEARIFSQIDPAGDLATVARDDFVALRGSWHW